MAKFAEALERYRHSCTQLSVLIKRCKLTESKTEDEKKHLEECFSILMEEVLKNFVSMEVGHFEMCRVWEKEWKNDKTQNQIIG